MFRLAHLSDPHLGPLPEPRLRELAGKRVLGYLNWRLNRGRGAMRPAVLDALVRDIRAHAPDHTCVTGDIVNLALDGELAPALEWLASIGRPHAVSVVPGNHDAYVRGALRRATEAWGPYLKPDDGEAGRFPYLRRRGKVALVGLSSAVATAPVLATGSFDAGQALRLSAMLDHLRHEGLFRVILIHHPPTRGAIHWGARLIGADRLRGVLKRAGAELVLHGHTHRSSLEWLESAGSHVPVVGVPSASRSPGEGRSGAGWNLFEIAGDPGAWSLTRVERGFHSADAPPVELARRPLLTDGRPQII